MIKDFEDNGIKLMFGDCLERMKEIPDGSVDLILTDPPYNIARENNFHTMGRTGIDFGEWDKGFDLFSYMNLIPSVCSRNANIVIFNDWKNLGDIARYAESLGLVVKDMIRWEKTNPMPRNRDLRFITDYDCAVWLTMPKAKWTFNRQSETYDRCKFTGSIVSGKEKTPHTTQKPVWLMEELLKTLSNKGDVVLDMFMGSGSTGVAALNTNRKFIGVEMNEGYFNIAKDRIENHSVKEKT